MTVLARKTDDEGDELRIELHHAHGSCWLTSFRNTEWLNAQGPAVRWREGTWYLLRRTPSGPSSRSVAVEEAGTPMEAMSAILGTFMVMDDFNLFDAAELERLLSPDSMRDLSLTLEVMDS